MGIIGMTFRFGGDYLAVREQRFQEKMDLVLAKAGKLIYTQGYQATSMKDIAAACDLGMNAIYSVFGSKEEICAQLYLRAVKEFAREFSLVLARATPLPEKNRELVHIYIDFYSVHNFLYEIVWLVLDGQLDSVLSPAIVTEIHKLFEEILVSYSNLLEQLQEQGRIRDDLEPRAMAATMWSMMSGMAANFYHKTQKLTGVPHVDIRETELDMVLSYLEYKGRK